MPPLDPNKYKILTNKEERPSIWLVQVHNTETNIVFGTRLQLKEQPSDEFVLNLFQIEIHSRQKRWWVEAEIINT